jgi:hypothetical protein
MTFNIVVSLNVDINIGTRGDVSPTLTPQELGGLLMGSRHGIA